MTSEYFNYEPYHEGGAVDGRSLSSVIALVSGKGGSGKTLIATAIALGYANAGKRVLLIDADFGTGGLTYYLGFSAFERAREGLTEVMIQRDQHEISPLMLKEYTAKASFEAQSEAKMLSLIDLMPVGEHRQIEDGVSNVAIYKLREILEECRHKYDCVIFDCRGGIDYESLSVCDVVGKIILVVETDAASIQASRHLSEVLHKNGYGKKLSGFILNKVIDDPSAMSQAGLTFFKCENLGSIPFDIQTTRNFIKGEIPQISSIFCRHVFKALWKADRAMDKYSSIKTLSREEFNSFATRDPYASGGGLVISAIAFYALLGMSIAYFNGGREWLSSHYIELLSASLVGVIVAASDKLRNSIGYVFRVYAESPAVLMRRLLRT
ncbi:MULTISPECIES: AAA family ATPase [Asticcacaulis]|uniref:AAA family ATPase n=1 Tax=Asticcacaulis TaxID=76890 RepID=UPI001AEB0592|nr:MULTISPECIES: AAA family ATPase [Asticcacaulis]MBP2161781.1 flagellar biosynthesis protein FlhG [Asticcacaulis solisilvae]MDR6802827.1 flagellar biosynthesis protein FlhG [Asticcacaulis sp. BE141]